MSQCLKNLHMPETYDIICKKTDISGLMHPYAIYSLGG